MEAGRIRMRNRLGTVCMLLGALLVLGALVLFLFNQQTSQAAEDFSRNMIPVLQEEIAGAQRVASSDLTELENVPVELLKPEDVIMTEKIIDGNAYIGYLTIGELGLELPVMSGWSSDQLQISPCRFSGTVRGEDLVIMAHNYKSHFGSLAQLQQGDEVRFADMDGNVWHYQVVATDNLGAEEVEAMTAGDYDLTLFTCATNRIQRVTVRCDKIK